jgi:sugar (pentulose or hexulose) kinase
MSVLAVDLGTGSVKVAVVDEELRVLASTSRPYAVRAPRPGAAESEPGHWQAAVEDAAAAVLAAVSEAPSAVGLCAQMHGVVLLGADGVALAPAVLWPDTRAQAETDRLVAASPDLRTRLGNPLVPGMAGPILAMLARSEPVTIWRAVAAVQPKDWLRVALAGPEAVASDPSDASATLAVGRAGQPLGRRGVSPARRRPRPAPAGARLPRGRGPDHGRHGPAAGPAGRHRRR